MKILDIAFAQNEWDPADWIKVKSPLINQIGYWTQEEDHIYNSVPADISENEMSAGSRVNETYSSMVHKNRLMGDMTINSTMSFDHRMAPLIMLAPEVIANDIGILEYRKQIEVVIWDEGVNIWQYDYKEAKASYKKIGYAKVRLEPKTKYEVDVQKKDNVLIVRVAGYEFGYYIEKFPNEFYPGITGCEGRNRFYNFTVNQ